ncbi:MAG: sigma-70 family RNA polymerase sigma factor [Polyangiaceae bacterium]
MTDPASIAPLAPPLLPRVASGDAAAVRECIARYGGLVWSLARRLSANEADAEDAAQEIFVDLWKSAPRFDPSLSSEVTFIAMIARRRLIDRRRRNQRRTDTEPLPDASALVTEAYRTDPTAELSAEASIAAQAVARLGPEQRDVVILGSYYGYSHEEIASSTGLPLGTVKSHARRGLSKVRDLLSEAASAVTSAIMEKGER